MSLWRVECSENCNGADMYSHEGLCMAEFRRWEIKFGSIKVKQIFNVIFGFVDIVFI